MAAPSLRRFVLLLALVACLPPASALAQDVARMDAIVHSYVDDKRFMGAVLVARDGDVLFSKGYGQANLEWQVPNTPTTKFRLGSLTKQFTAAAVLLLEERGKLKTDDLVKVHMPDAPAVWDKVTIFHLLTHTSGIPNFTALPEYRQMQSFNTPVVDVVARTRDKPLEFVPGERMNYSNSGYVLLGYLIEKISGQSYAQFVTENIFTPLGMKDSGYDSNEAVIARRASGYTPGPNGPVHAGFIHMSIPHAAGALYSTAEDLLRWEQGLFGGRILSAVSVRKMTTPFKNDYALGVVVTTVDGRPRIFHGGAIEGFNTSLVYYPESKVVVLALANLNGPAADQMTAQLGKSAHGEAVVLTSERKEITLPPQALERYAGSYTFRPGLDMVVTVENGRLMTQLGPQPKVPIFPESATTFFARVVDAQIEFKIDTAGKVTALVLRQGPANIEAPRK
jgi:CubicO group peptidase (beta-lactamase class C family)